MITKIKYIGEDAIEVTHNKIYDVIDYDMLQGFIKSVIIINDKGNKRIYYNYILQNNFFVDASIEYRNTTIDSILS